MSELKPIQGPTRLPDEEKLSELNDVIESTVNRLGIDSEVNMPDYIIAEYMVEDFKNMILTKKSYEKWRDGNN